MRTYFFLRCLISYIVNLLYFHPQSVFQLPSGKVFSSLIHKLYSSVFVRRNNAIAYREKSLFYLFFLKMKGLFKFFSFSNVVHYYDKLSKFWRIGRDPVPLVKMGRVTVKLDRFSGQSHLSVPFYPYVLSFWEHLKHSFADNILFSEACLFFKFFIYTYKPVIDRHVVFIAYYFVDGKPVKHLVNEKLEMLLAFVESCLGLFELSSFPYYVSCSYHPAGRVEYRKFFRKDVSVFIFGLVEDIFNKQIFARFKFLSFSILIKVEFSGTAVLRDPENLCTVLSYDIFY